MKQRLPTILILLVMVLIGAMYWLDLSYYTDPITGFITHGPIWARYLLLLLPALMCILGLRTIGPRAISVLRTRSRGLGGIFAAAGAVGVVYGITQAVVSLQQPDTFHLITGILFIWYGVWMGFTAWQMFTQRAPSPTRSAVWGILAAIPFSLVTVYRILVQPSTLYRVGPLVQAVGALLAMLWFGLLLRSLYIAMPRRRLRWTYLVGVFTFLFCTCLELPYAVYSMTFSSGTGINLFESINMAMFGLVAGCVSVAIAGRSAGPAPQEAEGEKPAAEPKPEAQEPAL